MKKESKFGMKMIVMKMIGMKMICMKMICMKMVDFLGINGAQMSIEDARRKESVGDLNMEI